MTSPENNAKRIRLALRQRRRMLSARQQRKHAEAVSRQLQRLSSFRRAKVIAVYLAADGEINLNPFLRLARRNRKTLLLPVLHPFRHGHLMFRKWSNSSKMLPNRFGIHEPARGAGVIGARSIDMVIMPLVGFDSSCHRIGMGGGYYDRTFAFRSVIYWRRPCLVGVAHALQQVEKITVQPWDVSLDAVITERAIYQCRYQSQ